MSETMTPASEMKEFAISLAKVQAKLMGAKKDTANPFFKSMYADLASVWEACRKPLTDEGFSVVQIPEVLDGKKVRVTTILLHKSGHSLQGQLTIPVEKENPQAIGSAITYARRYSLSAMVGVAPDDDDDGNYASGNGHRNNEGAGGPHPANQQTPQNKPEPAWQPHPDDVDRLVNDPAAFAELFKKLDWNWAHFITTMNKEMKSNYQPTDKIGTFAPEHKAHLAAVMLIEKHTRGEVDGEILF